MDFFTQILLLVFLLSSSHFEADDDDKTIVQKLCTQTLEPDSCLNCITADTSRATSNVTDITYSVLSCMYSQATYAHQTADQLFQNTTAVNLKKSFQVCKDVLLSASNTLWDAIAKMEVKDYKNAHLSARVARLDLYRCVFAIRKYANERVPSELLGHMVEAKRLFDVAEFMFLVIVKYRWNIA